MIEDENAATVKQIYSAFGRGDIPSVLRMVESDVEWIVPGPSEIPWYGIRRGKDDLTEYFACMAQHLDIRVFAPRAVIAQGDKVAVVVHIEYALQHNAHLVEQDHAHLWMLRDGKIVRFQDFQETAGVAAAWRGM